MAKKQAEKKQASVVGRVEIGQTVRALREKKGLTTTSFAALVGVSQAQVSRLENGQQGFRSDVIIRIAESLGVKPWFLFMTQKEQDKAGKAARA